MTDLRVGLHRSIRDGRHRRRSFGTQSGAGSTSSVTGSSSNTRLPGASNLDTHQLLLVDWPDPHGGGPAAMSQQFFSIGWLLRREHVPGPEGLRVGSLFALAEPAQEQPWALRPSARSHVNEATHSVLLVEEDAIVRDWIRRSLDDSEFFLAAEASTAAEAEVRIRKHRPELLLVDYRLPDRSGTELVRDLRRKSVQAAAVIMAATAEEGLNEASREAGAQATLLRTVSANELLAALRAVASGAGKFDARHPSRRTEYWALSPRERDVLRLVATGATNTEIAAVLGVGVGTVKTLLARGYFKLGVNRRAQAVAEAQRRGLL